MLDYDPQCFFLYHYYLLKFSNYNRKKQQNDHTKQQIRDLIL